MNNEKETEVSNNDTDTTISNNEIDKEISNEKPDTEISNDELDKEISHNETQKKESTKTSKKLSALWADKRSFKKRFLMSLAAVFAACFTFIFFGPLELVAFSGESLVFGYKDVVWLLLTTMLVVTAVLSLLISLLKGKVFNYVVGFVCASTIGGYVQSLFLNGSLGTLTGDAVPWTEMRSDLALSICIWLVIYIAVYLLMYLNRKTWTNFVYYVSALLVLVQFIPMVGILGGAYDTGSSAEMEDCELTTSGMYEYSLNKNVFVFVLDRLDFNYIEQVLKEDPKFFDRLDGFTGYDNAISAFARTKPALNQMLTGCEDLAYKVPTDEFFKESWHQDGKDLLRDISNEKFTTEFYTDVYSLFSDPDYVSQYVLNSNSGPKQVDKKTLLGKLMELSAYRYLPVNFKPFYWSDTNYFNQDVLVSEDAKTYVFADHEYADGFKTAVSDRKQNSFKFYHFNGPHAPYTLDKEGKLSKTETSAKEQLMGCMNILYDAFDRMKELCIYDDATIIITGDHGMHQGDTKPVLAATRTGLFYKRSNSSGKKFHWSSAQVCTDNIPATIIKSVGGDYSLYGQPLDEIGEFEEITRYYYKSASSSGSYDEAKFFVYEITGDAADFDNWKLIRTEDITEDENKFY